MCITYISEGESGGGTVSILPLLPLSSTLDILSTLALSAFLIITGVGSNLPSEDTPTEMFTDGCRCKLSSFQTALDSGICCARQTVRQVYGNGNEHI